MGASPSFGTICPGRKVVHLWSSTALTHPSVISAWLQSPQISEIAARMLEPMNNRPDTRIMTSGSLGPQRATSLNLRRYLAMAKISVVDGILLGRTLQWSMNTWSGCAPEGVVPLDEDRVSESVCTRRPERVTIQETPAFPTTGPPDRGCHPESSR
jgi:hypothetical protein